MAVKLLGDLSASGNATFNSEVNLPSGGQIDWANGDARIIEGAVTNYSLSLQTYTGSALTTKMFIASGGNVGIGSTAPSEKLHVVGNGLFHSGANLGRIKVGRSANQEIEIYVDDTNNIITAYQDSDSNNSHVFALDREFDGSGANYFEIRKGGSAQMHIDTSGNVGIGTTAPLEKLHVVGKINSSNNIVSNSTYTMFTGRSSRTVDDYGGLNKEYFKANLVTAGPNTTGEASAHGFADLRFQLANSAGNTGMSDIMTLRSGGNVGIGTASPRAKLEVSGDIYQSWADAWNFIGQVYQDGSQYRNGIATNSASRTTQIEARSAGTDGEITFLIGTGEVARMLHGGNVGIGTTSPSEKLQVSGNVSASTFITPAVHSKSKIRLHATGNDAHSIGTAAYANTYGPGTWDSGTIMHQFYGSTGNIIAQLGVGGSTSSANTSYFTGNVGIGTTSPNTPLTIETNTSDVLGALKIKNAGAGDASMFFTVNASGAVWQLGIDNSDGDKFKIGQDTQNADVGVGTKLTIDSSGKVGIGTTSPDVKLEVAGTIKANFQTNTTGTSGSTFLNLHNNVGGDISQQQTFIDFSFSDSNANFTPQVRIGAQVGRDADANAISKEGAGAFVVYTGDGTDELGAGTLTESFRVSYNGDGSFDGDVTANNLSGTNTGDQTLPTLSSLGAAPLASPALTGTPTAPTAGATVNTTQLATTAFVQTAIANLSDSAPDTLNTLNELAAALGDDASFSTTVTNSIAAKLPLAGGTMTGSLTVEGDLNIGKDGTTPQVKLIYDDNHTNGDRWDTIIDIGRTQDRHSGDNEYPTYVTANGYSISFQASSDGVLFGMENYSGSNYRPVIAWGDDNSDTPFNFRFNNGVVMSLGYNGVLTSTGNMVAGGNFKTTGNLDMREQNEENSTNVIYFNANNGNASNTSNDVGTGIVWKPLYTTYTKRSAGIMQMGEGNYFKSGLGFFTNNTSNATTDWSERMRISKEGNVGIGVTEPTVKLQVNGAVEAGGKTTYLKSYGSLDTTGNDVAGLIEGFNGGSALFTFTCYGDTGGYQKIVYSCYNTSGTTWNVEKVIDEGTNDFDITVDASGSTRTFTFVARSGTKAYSPRVIVEASGSSLDKQYL